MGLTAAWNSNGRPVFTKTEPDGNNANSSDDERSGTVPQSLKPLGTLPGPTNTLPKPSLSGPASAPAGSLLKGPVKADGTSKDPLLMIGIKLDLEADIHINARVRGDILVGLY
ncbi:hypothetical protein BKA67DRAFT_540512 [Truncatella angustata]|uniref:Uncharacterized protein n=1 Tax=Truncatella angustata TaxID=152316 RepID=A0A9P8RPP4_9PEZI|nr:uncharacterized protein BKA67DRAFT_540512 [Truncatella angustata]KAH6647050.1 hypothetical protein BKA67DRAFT_540512 [Truncatella angustata]